MIRPVLIELALFATPFALYTVYLLATRSGVLDGEVWTLPVFAWLTGAAIALMVASFVLIAHFSGAPPGSTYVPAHVEDGRIVPGQTQ